MDELERAGRALREAFARGAEPNDRLRARARDIVRHRRIAIAGSVATVVIAASVGIGFAARGGNGLGVHTIAPAASSTSLTPTTTHVVPTSPTIAGAREVDQVQPMPNLAFADSSRGWRVDPLLEAGLDGTTDGGRTWRTQLDLGVGNTVNGVIAIDDRHAFALVTFCCDGTRSALMRATDGSHWKPTAAAGLVAPLGFVTFTDANHGWGITRYGDLAATADAGGHWRTMAKPNAAFGADRVLVAGLCLASPGAGWAVAGTSVYRTDDNGATWRSQLTIPLGGAAQVVCNGSHAAYASYDHGAGQTFGGFLRTDDGGAQWSVLTEDRVGGRTSIVAAGLPDNQGAGEPNAMTSGGTLVFTTACHVCGPPKTSVVAKSPSDPFVVHHFDSTTLEQIMLIAATAVDSTHLFAEAQAIAGGGTGPRPVTLFASSDGGRTWSVRWTGQ